jgi:alkylation response protein AidB-like acyl-CoA dehydrogenase
MLLRPTGELAVFREEVRAFLAEEAPADVQAKVRANADLHAADHRRWHAVVHRRGWAAPNWPREWGGTGWSPLQRYVWEIERAAFDLPRLLPVGLNMVGPVLLAYGSDEQKRRFLPTILNGEDIWCQGYSEPEAGSDLASLRCRAEPIEGGYRVTGTKIWTSYAHFSDWIFMLVRTSSEGPRQRGITVLLVDMRSPGVSVRPLTGMAGVTTFNEIRFEGVEVPEGNRVGAENEGWAIAKYLLGHERAGTAFLGESRRLLQRLREEAAAAARGAAGSLADDPLFHERLARLEIQLLGLEATAVRAMARLSADGEVGLEASFLKLRGTELLQGLQRLLADTAGLYGLAHFPEALRDGTEPPAAGLASSFVPIYLEGRKASIFGGTNEIQRSIIAKRLLA